MSSPKVGFFCS